MTHKKAAQCNQLERILVLEHGEDLIKAHKSYKARIGDPTRSQRLSHQHFLNSSPVTVPLARVRQRYSSALRVVIHLALRSFIKAGTVPFELRQVPANDITLSWSTFSNAADQAGMSRRYGGIHFEQGDLMGRAMGRKVAEVA